MKPTPDCCRLKGKPPDGGWSWVVLIGAFLLFVVYSGFYDVYSIVFKELRQRYDAPAHETAWVSAINESIKLLLAPFISSLAKYSGTRILTVLGGLLYSLGLFLTAYSTSIKLCYLYYGVFGGIGASMALTCYSIAVSEYFVEKKGMAILIMHGGAGVGSLLYSLLIKYLFPYYGFTGTMLIFSGLSLHICVSGMVLRPIIIHKKSSSIKFDTTVFKNLEFSFFLIFAFFAFMGSNISFVFLADYAKEKEFNTKEIAGIYIVTSVATLVTKLLTGLVIDINRVRRHRSLICSFVALTGGVSALLITTKMSNTVFSANYVVLVTVISLYFTHQVIAITDNVKPYQIGEAIGVLRFIQGVSVLIGPVLAGTLRDKTGTYFWSLMLSGSLMCFGSIIFIIPYICRKI